MPPRARKSAAPSPSLEGSAGLEMAAPAEAAAAAEDETAPPVPEDAAPQEPVATEPEAPESTPAGRAVADLLEPPAVTNRWVSANGDGSAPCRLCAPAGPPVGAGSFGCSHGQWVRVTDEAD